MSINIQQLIDCDWDYIAHVESSVGAAISSILNQTFPSFSNPLFSPPQLTTGNNPNYDVSINQGTFEIKCSSKKDILHIETMCNDKPSGLLTSTALYYVFVNPGKSKIDNEWVDVCKVRIIPRSELLYRAMNLAKSPDRFSTSPDGSNKWFTLDAKDLPDDGWFADVDIKNPLSPVSHEVVKHAKQSFIRSIGISCLLGVVAVD